jgi:hypothetical protein
MSRGCNSISGLEGVSEDTIYREIAIVAAVSRYLIARSETTAYAEGQTRQDRRSPGGPPPSHSFSFGWGPGGRRFKSCLPDRRKALQNWAGFQPRQEQPGAGFGEGGICFQTCRAVASRRCRRADKQAVPLPSRPEVGRSSTGARSEAGRFPWSGKRQRRQVSMVGQATTDGGGAWRRVAPTTTARVGSSRSVGPAGGETWSSSVAGPRRRLGGTPAFAQRVIPWSPRDVSLRFGFRPGYRGRPVPRRRRTSRSVPAC